MLTGLRPGWQNILYGPTAGISVWLGHFSDLQELEEVIMIRLFRETMKMGQESIHLQKQKENAKKPENTK